jgi:hypothetical protein
MVRCDAASNAVKTGSSAAIEAPAAILTMPAAMIAVQPVRFV